MHWSFHVIHAVEPAFLFDAAEITDFYYLGRARSNSGGRGIRLFRAAAFDQRLRDSANRLAGSCGGRLDPRSMKIVLASDFFAKDRAMNRPGLSQGQRRTRLGVSSGSRS
jgi:hypothetical protein